ncbi:S-adenosylmethionine mitochondrial carrier protein homolog [Ctenocephalides felis]|uniref:S-adenosylmethionine mitochondrial carrier protein homolog n=1 Tax=Ctenocephalides felis TaxID=7515 RepID=UPI000E6E3AEA|nr:S-adenosylmethionine mitochondrial carrier protein homolog [Ctenocephalides felis]
MDNTLESKNVYLSSLVSGGVAGLVVDIALFPLDTLKTRLQSPKGFIKSGGFRGIYHGLGPAAIGSAPSAALFFCTYESFKHLASPYVSSSTAPLIHMAGASVAEVVACLVRVPVEVVKQRKQTAGINRSSIAILKSAYRIEGFLDGIYRGFGSTILREIPFSFIQFPLWEYFKKLYVELSGSPLNPLKVSLCGALAGGIAAAATTPLDVVKTRIMLAELSSSKVNLKILSVLKNIYRENGISGLFAGIVPRVLWITIGGAIFFGSYDLSKRMFEMYHTEPT